MAQIIRRGTKAEPRWLVRISRGRVNGKRTFLNKTIAGTKKQAQSWAAEQERAMSLGSFVEPSPLTLAEFLAVWIEKEADNSARPETVRHYADQLHRYIPASLGGKKLSDLRRIDFNELYGDLHRRGLSPRTIQYLHAILRRALNDAVGADRLHRNPTDRTTRPKRSPRRMTVLNGAEVGIFLRAAKSDAYFAYWWLLLETGLRPSEAFGLMWADVGTGEIRVRRGARNINGRWVVNDCKTESSERTVLISADLAGALCQWRVRPGAPVAGPATFVFAGAGGTLPDVRALQRHHFARILDRAGLPRMRVYDLRHTSASIMLSRGMPVRLVSERLGHASTKVTLDTYAHTLAEDHVRLADVFKVFSPVEVVRDERQVEDTSAERVSPDPTTREQPRNAWEESHMRAV